LVELELAGFSFIVGSRIAKTGLSDISRWFFSLFLLVDQSKAA